MRGDYPTRGDEGSSPVKGRVPAWRAADARALVSSEGTMTPRLPWDGSMETFRKDKRVAGPAAF